MLTIIDFGGGNIKSVSNMLASFGLPYTVTDTPEGIQKASRIVFPGQGHFGQVMEALKFKGLAEPLIRSINEGKTFLGICVGLQILFESSEEAPGAKGLGVLKGKCVRFKKGKIPQVGWNKIQLTPANLTLAEDYYYFVNSYYVVPKDESIVTSYADYHVRFPAAIRTDNIFAAQFHPEKSGQAGFNALQNWMMRSGIGM